MFMEFYRDEKGELTKLSQHNVDTGMGFERMCKVMQNKESVYETDLSILGDARKKYRTFLCGQ